MQGIANRKAVLRTGGVLALAVIFAGFGYAFSHISRVHAMTRGFAQDMVAMHEGHHRMDPEHMVAMMTEHLDLTTAQQEQVRTILTNGEPAMRAFHQQMKQLHSAVMATALQTPFDEAKVRTVITQNMAGLVDQSVEMARVHSQIYAVLTPEQQTKMQKHVQHEMPMGGDEER